MRLARRLPDGRRRPFIVALGATAVVAIVLATALDGSGRSRPAPAAGPTGTTTPAITGATTTATVAPSSSAPPTTPPAPTTVSTVAATAPASPPTTTLPPISAEAPPEPTTPPTSAATVADPCVAGEGPSVAAPLPEDPSTPGVGRWVVLASLTGRCDATSEVFTTAGVDTRLRVRSDAPSFFAYVVDAEEGLEATAGFADAECAGPCSEVQALVNEAGRFRLQVRASGGPWEMSLEEFRPAQG